MLDQEGEWNFDELESSPYNYFKRLCKGPELIGIVDETNRNMYGSSNPIGFQLDDLNKYIGIVY